MKFTVTQTEVLKAHFFWNYSSPFTNLETVLSSELDKKETPYLGKQCKAHSSGWNYWSSRRYMLDSHTHAPLLTFAVNQWKILKMRKSFNKSLENVPNAEVCSLIYLAHSEYNWGQNNVLKTHSNSTTVLLEKRHSPDIFINVHFKCLIF